MTTICSHCKRDNLDDTDENFCQKCRVLFMCRVYTIGYENDEDEEEDHSSVDSFDYY